MVIPWKNHQFDHKLCCLKIKFVSLISIWSKFFKHLDVDCFIPIFYCISTDVQNKDNQVFKGVIDFFYKTEYLMTTYMVIELKPISMPISSSLMNILLIVKDG